MYIVPTFSRSSIFILLYVVVEGDESELDPVAADALGAAEADATATDRELFGKGGRRGRTR
jgi:hypothetical protein